MKLFKFKKIVAGLAAATMLASVPAAVGALDDFSFTTLASSEYLAQECFEKYKKQFGGDATKTNAFEIVKQYQDEIDGLILIFEDHEKRLCALENKEYSPKTDLSVFSKGKYDNGLHDSEEIIGKCKKHAIYDGCFEKFTTDSDVVDIIKTYQEMVDVWLPKLAIHEVQIQNIELKLLAREIQQRIGE